MSVHVKVMPCPHDTSLSLFPPTYYRFPLYAQRADFLDNRAALRAPPRFGGCSSELLPDVIERVSEPIFDALDMLA